MSRIVLQQTAAARRLLSMALGLAALAALAGCGGKAAGPVQTEILPYTPEQLAAREAAQDARYQLRVGDRFKVAFKYEPDLDQDDVLIMPDGFVSMKGLGGAIRAGGMTVDQLDAALESAYGQDYRNPDLSVIVYSIANPEIYVLGFVKAPGLYKLPDGGSGIVQAVAMAGGFIEDSKSSRTVLMRATETGFLVRTFDLSHLENMGPADLSYFDLQPYDIVYVPRSDVGTFAHIADRVFGSALNITRFFWDIYALGNLDKINTIIR